jgi:TonB-linked SusC/RagA family outer membrane protein
VAGALGLLLAAGAAGRVGAQEQSAVISGKVATEDGRPISGATVYITALNVGALADDAGNYRMVIPAPRVRGQTVALGARFIGYKPVTKQVVLNLGAQTANFALPQDINRLSQVVVTGVSGATEQVKVPFSVQKVDAADMPVPAANPLTQLQGRVPGANIVSASGRPGSSPSVLLRGPTSINAAGRGQNPLYVVDGVILNGPLSDLNSQDIASVEVVEGAAAASLYGARAGNGVISITTKRGKSGGNDGFKFNVRSEYGVSDIERSIAIADRHGMWLDETGTRFCQTGTQAPGMAVTCVRSFDYATESYRINDQSGDYALDAPGFPVDPGSSASGAVLRNRFQINRWPGKTYNAIDQFAKPSPFMLGNVDLSGRVGQTSVFASFNHLDQGGAIRFLDGFKRNSFRLNLDQGIGDNWNFSFSSFYSRNSQDGGDQEDGFNGGAFFRLTRVPPVVDLLRRDSQGRLFVRPNLQGGGTQNYNPLYQLSAQKQLDVYDRFIGGSTVKYTPFTWMDLEGNFSYDISKNRTTLFDDKGYRTTTADPATTSGYLYTSNSTNTSYNTGLTATLRHDLRSDLRSRTTIRYLYEQQDNNFDWGDGSGLAAVGVPTLANVTNSKRINSGQQSVSGIGAFIAQNLEFKERYILDALVREDGSSLFGADHRWATFGRAALAWRVSEEPWWFIPKLNEFKLRSSIGSAGGRPQFFAQYETYNVNSAGALTKNLLGNRDLGPEVTLEREFGVDAEAFNRIGLNLTFANADTRDQILNVPVPSITGYQFQWRNAGTMNNKTFEASLNLPIVTTRSLNYSTRFTYARTRTTITKLNSPPFNFGVGAQNGNSIFLAQEGEEYGSFYGRAFLRNCSELPSDFRSQCGDGKAFQKNDDGWVVWTGDGNSWRDGITQNLWQTSLPGCVNAGGATVACTVPGAIVNAPWGVGLAYGMPIILRTDEKGVDQSGRVVKLGSALPKYRWAVSQTLSFKRLTASALVDASVGRKIFNQGRTWSYLDFLSKDQDQTGKSIETAKPQAYYYRAGPPDNSAGIGGLYDVLGPNNNNVESGSFAKLRELSMTYDFGQLLGVGPWNVSVVGRNLHTWTKYKGFDPEVGYNSSLGQGANSAVNQSSGSGAINAIDAFTFPNQRTVTFSLGTSF